MSFSFTQATGDGVTKSFIFSFEGPDFGYFREDDIFVYVDDTEVPFTITGPNQVTISEAPPLGSSVMIRRVMPEDAPYTDFVRGNNFGKDNINRSFQQQLYLLHQLMDGFLPDGFYLKKDLDLGGNKIRGVGAATLPGDVYNKEQVDELIVALVGAGVNVPVQFYLMATEGDTPLDISSYTNVLVIKGDETSTPITIEDSLGVTIDDLNSYSLSTYRESVHLIKTEGGWVSL